MSDASFRELLERAIAGNESARNRLFEEVRASVEGLTRTYRPPASLSESASDLIQDVCIKLARRLDQFRGLDDERLDETAVRRMFFAWVKSTVAHEISNRFRDAAVERLNPPGERLHVGPTTGDSTAGSRDGFDPAGSVPTPSAIVGDDEAAALVRRALDQLADPLDREIVRLAHFEGVSLRQIASRLDISLDKVRGRYHKSLNTLASVLGPLLGLGQKP
jgi:RNA polymerase sigma factor (sigma-70 family)